MRLLFFLYSREGGGRLIVMLGILFILGKRKGAVENKGWVRVKGLQIVMYIY